MDLEFTEEQEELRSSVRDFLAGECPMTVVRRVVESGEPADDLWRSMQKLDWPSLVVAEELGGIGGGPAELAILAEEIGRSLAPVPLLPTVSQLVPVVAELGNAEQRERVLRGVAEQGMTGALALADHPARWDPADVTARAERRGDRWVLTGEKLAVSAGPDIDELAVVTRVSPPSGTDGADGTNGSTGSTGSTGSNADGSSPGGAQGGAERLGVFLVPAERVSFDVRPGLDASRPLSTVRLDAVEIEDDRVLGSPGHCGAGLRRAIEVATVATALETVGACDVLLELTRQHTLDRQQFGVPIGSFQAIKHKLADDFVSLSRARAVALYAVAALEEDHPDRSTAVSMAKAATDDCQRLICQDAIQTLGGIGFTWEHDAHLYVKRAKTCGALFGNAVEHRRRIAASLGLPVGA